MLRIDKTVALMTHKMRNEDFDSFALHVKIGERETTITSDNVDEDTYFDIASCGKVLVTTPLILQAVTEGKLSLNSTLDEFFADVPQEKKRITIKQLLSHTSGIVRINLSEQAARAGRAAVIKEILSVPLAFEPGTNYVYSCNGMILLGFIVEKIFGDSLENCFEERLKKPLGYTRAKFNIALDEPNAAVCYRSRTADGYEHPWDDENVRTLRTSLGNGGQFFTLADIKRFAAAVESKDERLYGKELFALAESEISPPIASESRGLGWLIVDEKYKQTGKLFPKGSFGHCGHCGQSMFFNRELGLRVVLLTNATRFASKRNDFKRYDYGEVMKMREEVHDSIYADLSADGLL